MSGALSGKIVLLTGAAGGQGKVAARMIAQAGGKVVMTDRNPAAFDLAQALHPAACFVQHDVTDQADWAAAVAVAFDRFGGLDVLINNAAIASRDSVETLSGGALHGYFDVNVVGALNGIQAVLPVFRARGGGSIVNIASISAVRATPGLVGYGISKWALRGLTRNAAVELAADRIRVNLVLPGAVAVSMIKDADASRDKHSVASQVPIGRAAIAEEIASTAIFLPSEAASYVTGAELIVDGGWCA